MGPPSRTTASTPVLIRTLDFQIILGKGAPTLTPPHRGSSRGSDHCSAGRPRLSPSIDAGWHSGFVMPHAAAARGGVCLLVSGGADSVDELCPSGFESSAVTGDRWLGEFGGCQL